MFIFVFCFCFCFLPLELGARTEILVDELEIVGLELVDIRGNLALAVEVVRIEALHPLEVLTILIVEKVLVLALAVPRVKAVETDHVQRRQGHVVLDDVVEVLVVTPREMDAVQAAATLVNAELCLQVVFLEIGVVFEKFGEDNAVRVLAAHGERVADNALLRLAPEAEDLFDTVR